MFTSMDLDKELFNKAWRLSGLKTKKAVVEEALKLLVRLHEQAGVRELRGKLVWEEPEPPKRRRRAGSR
ncbi:MAG TPA: type II toxin-antitoxin system VapB family antitoxin [Thermoanaerobaculia bacterium]|nr:type II toxin-antitoxin system VapB family antitoxin [Thermoanaerobaculia bacterium]